MNVNGARFHLLLGEGDWGTCSTSGPSPVTLAAQWSGPEAAVATPVFDTRSRQLTLLPLVEPIPATPGEPMFTAADHRDAAADRNGNLYVVSDEQFGLTVRSAGTGIVTPFWPRAARRRRGLARTFGDAAPLAETPDRIAGLAITGRDFLVAGTGNGLLRFDLVGGGAPERLRLPESFTATALAPADDEIGRAHV